ncbi:MAG: hypothetical protein JXA24_06330 [Proteobacteria bacterium]|nr:hypothetical protein [Pseudomonadota bacterium]
MHRPITAQSILPVNTAASPAFFISPGSIAANCPYARSLEDLARSSPARMARTSSVTDDSFDPVEMSFRTRFERRFGASKITAGQRFAESVRLSREMKARMEQVRDLIDSARKARNDFEFDAAARSYRLALYELHTAIDAAPFSTPLYQHINDGAILVTEAVLESSNLSDSKFAAENVHRLDYFLKNPPAGGYTELDLVKAKILKAKNIAGYTSDAANPDIATLEKRCDEMLAEFKTLGERYAEEQKALAQSRAEGAHGPLEQESEIPWQQALRDEGVAVDDEIKELHLFAGISCIELMSRLFFYAHHRQDNAAVMKHIGSIGELLNDIQAIHVPEGIDKIIAKFASHTDAKRIEEYLNRYRNLVASYRSAATRLFLGTGYLISALPFSRIATSAPFEMTSGAREVLKHPALNDFSDGMRIYDDEELGDLGKKVSLLSGLICRSVEAVRNAGSEGLVDSLKAGATGLVAGSLIDAILSGFEWPGIVVGSGTAAAVYLINMLKRGWETEQAKTAFKYGLPKRDAVDYIDDASKLILMFEKSALWLVPMLIISNGPDIGTSFVDTACAFIEGYGNIIKNIPGWMSSLHSSLVEPLSIQNLQDNVQSIGHVLSMESGQLPTYLMTKLLNADWLEMVKDAMRHPSFVAFLYFLLLFVPKINRATTKTWWPVLFSFLAIPAAAFLGTAVSNAQIPADASLLNAMQPEGMDPWLDRVIRSCIFYGGALMLLLNSGLAKVDRTLGPRVFHSLTSQLGIFAGHDPVGAENLWSLFKQSVISLFKALDPRKVDYNLAFLMIMVNALTSPLGKVIQSNLDDPKNIALLFTRGIFMTMGFLMITLLMSGVLKGKIPLVERMKQAWEDSGKAGYPIHRAGLEVLLSGLGAIFTSSYSSNRIFRSFIYDPLGSSLRYYLGWDTNEGVAAMELVNNIGGNGSATATWNEISGTSWERDPILQDMSDVEVKIYGITQKVKDGEMTAEEGNKEISEKLDALRDKLKISGQSMHLGHLFMDHAEASDLLWPARSCTRAFSPPVFPHIVNTYFYQNIYQIIMDDYDDLLDGKAIDEVEEGRRVKWEIENEERIARSKKPKKFKEKKKKGRDNRKLTEGELDVLFHLIRMDAPSADNSAHLKPLLEVLVLARGSERFGGMISDFLKYNSWILQLLDIDPNEVEKRAGITDESGMRHPMRRVVIKRVRRALKTSFAAYEKRIKSHGRQPDFDIVFNEIFNIDPVDFSVPETEEQPDADVADEANSNEHS